ncbi:MAG: hypothetical protein Cons2KO_00890 [Congregibacter sp.]
MASTDYSTLTGSTRGIDNDIAYNNARSAFDDSYRTDSFCNQSLDALVDITAKTTCGGSGRDYGSLYTITGRNEGVTEFEFGMDWGRGGFLSLDIGGESELFRLDEDIWWGRNWGNSDVFGLTLGEMGDFSLTLLGFEGCCDGINSVRYRSIATEGSLFETSFTAPGSRSRGRELQSLASDPGQWRALEVNDVPLPGSLPLVALGGLLLLQRRRRNRAL